MCLAGPATAAETASTEDTAKFLAGLPVSDSSPLKALEALPAAKQHQTFFDTTFARVNEKQIDKVKAWSASHINVKRDTLFYFFGGPDYLYANAFFPDAKTYVLAGLESPGKVPDLTSLPKDEVNRALHALEGSLRSILGITFFQTKFMSGDFHRSKVTGNIPVLYIFLARSGKEVHSAELIQLNEDGSIAAKDSAPRPGAAKGVKITFSSPGGPEQTLYYFATDVSKNSFKTSGLEAFCDKLGHGDALVKSASYLLQGKDFAGVRDFILSHSDAILQDDTGIPIYRFDKTWDLTPFGNYTGPIRIFKYAYQKPLAALHQKKKAEPIDFSISYRYRPHEASLVWAVKLGATAEETKPSEAKPEAASTDKKVEEKPKIEGKAPEEPDAKADQATKPGEPKPSETKSGDAKPSDSKADAAKPADAKPAEAKPDDSKPAEAKPADTKSTEAKPSEPDAPKTETTTVPKSDTKPADAPQPAH